MDQVPPQYSGYVRPTDAQYGSSEKLQALSDGYFGMSQVFAVAICINLISRFAITPESDISAALGFIVGGGLVIGLFTFGFAKKIAFGADKPESWPLMAAIVTGVVWFLFCAAIGVLWLQGVASKEMAKYGLRVRLFGGIPKKLVAAKVEQMREREQRPKVNVPPPTFG